MKFFSTLFGSGCAVALLFSSACGSASGPAVAGGSCTAGDLVCGAPVSGQSGIPVLHCLAGSNVYVEQMVCTSTCESVANDSTQVQCDGEAHWAVLNSACDLAGDTACSAAGGDGSNSTTVLTCASGHWSDTLDCPTGQHCMDTSSSPGTITLGCQ